MVVAFSLAKRNGKRARAATRQSLAMMTILAFVLAIAIEFWGHLIVDAIAGAADLKVKRLGAGDFCQTSAWSYPAAAITLIGSGAQRGAGNTKFRC